MFSIENGNDCRIRTEKYLSDALKYVETDENAKEIFEFNDEDTELLGCVWSRREDNLIKVNDICKSNKSNYQLYKILTIENGYALCLGFDGYKYTIPVEDLEFVRNGN